MKKILAGLFALVLCGVAHAQTLFPSGGVPGGSNTQLQFNSSSQFGGISGWTTNGTTALTGGASTTLAVGNCTIGANAFCVTGPSSLAGQVTNALGTITTSQPFSITQTWNAGGVTFNALLVNVTSTASAAASMLQDWQIAGSSVASVGKAGTFRSAVGYYNTGETQGVDFGAAAIRVYGQGASMSLTTAALQVKVTDAIGWSSTSAPNGSLDLTLFRDAANTLALRNSTNAQVFNIYNTYTDASNYDRTFIGYSGNIFYIQTLKAGSGTARPLNLISGSTLSLGANGTDNQWQITTSGHLIAPTDNTYDIGASGVTRPRTGYFGTSLFSPIVSTLTGLTLTAGAVGMRTMTASASAPGAAGSKLEVVCGTNAGSAKLVMYAGTSGTAVTVVDNVGTGVTGC